MYGNAYIDPNEKFSSEEETPELLAAFQARIDAGDKIEPQDWMPAMYRKQLIRMIEQHAHSEIIGSLPGRYMDYPCTWIQTQISPYGQSARRSWARTIIILCRRDAGQKS